MYIFRLRRSYLKFHSCSLIIDRLQKLYIELASSVQKIRLCVLSTLHAVCMSLHLFSMNSMYLHVVAPVYYVTREYELMTEAHAKLSVVGNCSGSSFPCVYGGGETADWQGVVSSSGG
jgi:hypothetical protein